MDIERHLRQISRKFARGPHKKGDKWPMHTMAAILYSVELAEHLKERHGDEILGMRLNYNTYRTIAKAFEERILNERADCSKQVLEYAVRIALTGYPGSEFLDLDSSHGLLSYKEQKKVYRVIASHNNSHIKGSFIAPGITKPGYPNLPSISGTVLFLYGDIGNRDITDILNRAYGLKLGPRAVSHTRAMIKWQNWEKEIDEEWDQAEKILAQKSWMPYDLPATVAGTAIRIPTEERMLKKLSKRFGTDTYGLDMLVAADNALRFHGLPYRDKDKVRYALSKQS